MVNLAYEEIEKNRIENIKEEILRLKTTDLNDYIIHKSRFFKISRFTLSNYMKQLEESLDIIIDRKKKTISIFSEAETPLDIPPGDICRICTQEIIGEASRHVFDTKKEINLHKACFQVAGIEELKELYRLSNDS